MTQYQKIARSIDYLVAHYQSQPDLNALAAQAGYEAAHFQKLFKSYVGISPKRLVQYMNMRHARELLGRGASSMDAAYAVGLSGGSRLHDLFVACEGVTPGAVKGRGQGLRITYGFHDTPLGAMMIGKTGKGVCWLGFVVDERRDVPVARMRAHWPLAEFAQDDGAIAGAAAHIMRIWRGQSEKGEPQLALDLYGTNFQIQVWQALLRIPVGETVTYQNIAQQVGKPTASRAVGNAVGANPVSLLIPCHRVIRASGIIDNYNWGSARKKLILAAEANLTY